MSEERFDRIDQALARLEAGQIHMQSRMEGLETGQTHMQSRMDGLEAGQTHMQSRMDGLEAGQTRLQSRMDGLEAGQTRLQSRMDGLEAGQTDMQSRFEGLDAGQAHTQSRIDGLEAEMSRGFTDLRRHMGVLHEEALARIGGVAEGFPRLEAKLDRNVAELKELIGQRCDPLDAAVRHHSIEIERLKRGRS